MRPPGEIFVWDVTTGEIKHRFGQNLPTAMRVQWSANGRLIAVACGPPGSVLVLAAPSLRPLKNLSRQKSRFQAVAFSPDSTMLAASSLDKSVRVWNTGNWQRRFVNHLDAGAEAVTFTADNRGLIVAAEDNLVHVFDTQSGQKQRSLQGHSSALASVAVASGGRTLATGDRTGTVRLWPAEAGYQYRTLSPEGTAAKTVAYSSDGNNLAIGIANGSVQLWNSQTEEMIRSLSGHTGTVRGLAFSSDGSRLISGASDRTARVWDVESGECIQILNGHTAPVEAVTFAPGGEKAATAGFDRDRTIRIWSIESGKELRTLKGHSRFCYEIVYTGQDGRLLASASNDGTVGFWDPEEGTLLNSLGINGAPVNGIASSPDGKLVAAAVGDNSLSGNNDLVAVIDVASQSVLQRLQGHAASVRRVAFSPTGDRLVSADFGSLRIWETQTWSTTLVVPSNHKEILSDLAFRADGQQVATVGERVHLWDAPIKPVTTASSD